MKKYVYLFACLWCMMLSCSHDPEATDVKEKGTNVVEWEDSTISGDAPLGKMMFSVGNVMSVERTAQTRATTDINGTATFSTNDLVAVAVTRSGGSEVVKLYKVKSDGSLEYAGGDNDPFVWKSTGETVSLRAWSYGTTTNLSYTLTPPESRDYTLETDQNTNGYLELLYCKAADKSYSGGTISLNFYHQLARVVFNVNHEYSGTLSVTSSSVGNSTSFPVAARFSVPTGSSNVGTWATRSTYGTITPKTETTQSGYQKTYSAVIFPKTYTQNTLLFTITNGDGDYVYKISENAGATLAIGNQYNYTITVKDDIFRRNPLWYVAPYNMVDANTMATTEQAGYYYLWSSAMSAFGSQATSYNDYMNGGKTYAGQNGTWHMPIRDEWRSIIPGDNSQSINIYAFDTGTGTYKATNLTVKFGYNATTKAGIEEASYWKRAAEKEIHAIRFLGTPYCSAWKYVIDTDNERFVIYATIIDQVANTSAAASTWYNNNFSSTTFDDNAGMGRVCRTLWFGGHTQNQNSSDATKWLHKYGYWWSATEDNYANVDGSWRINIRSDNSNWSFQVRMFRDN